MQNDNNYIFGVHPILEALRTGKEIDMIYLRKKHTSEIIPEILKLAREKQIPIHSVPNEKLNRMINGNHQGIVGVMAQITYMPFGEIINNVFEKGKSPLLVILDGVTDVRNLGAIARSAECAGADAIVFAAHNAAPVNSFAVKSSAGALSHIPVCRVPNLVAAVKDIKNYGLKIIAATEKGKVAYYDFDFKQPVALVLGAEDKGVDAAILKICDEMVRIPMVGKIQSLNVSVAAGIILFESLKQKLN